MPLIAGDVVGVTRLVDVLKNNAALFGSGHGREKSGKL
jgi:hypothetical protein